MGFAINVNNMERIRNYTQAHAHFTNTKKPRTVRWSENQRPLRNTAARHLRLEQRYGGEFYDCVLYSTSVVRYFKPDENGEYKVWLSNWASQSTSAFLWRMGWYDKMKLEHDGGDVFELPISTQYKHAEELWGDEFTVRLTFNKLGQVIRDKSIYLPVCSYRSSKGLRNQRKKFKADIALIMDMVDMRFGELQGKCVVDAELGEPFSSGVTGDVWKEEREARDVLTKFVRGEDVDLTPAIHYAFTYAQVAYDGAVNRKAYALKPAWENQWMRNSNGDWMRREHDGTYARDQEPLEAQDQHIKEKLLPTQEAVRKAVENRLIMAAGLSGGDTPIPYPQFAKTLPKTVYGVRMGMLPADLFVGVNPDILSKLIGKGVA